MPSLPISIQFGVRIARKHLKENRIEMLQEKAQTQLIGVSSIRQLEFITSHTAARMLK